MPLSSCLHDLEKEISQLSRYVHESEIIQSHLSYIKNLVHRDIPTQLIKEILNNNELLEIIARRSYEHVNHFNKIVLIDNLNIKGFRLTLHSWSCHYDDKTLEQELIHNHRFSFWSHIYRGTLLSENFKEASSFSIEKKAFRKYIYRPSQTGNIHTCEFDKEVQLTKLDNHIFEQGQSYYLNFDITHRVLLPQRHQNLCTFVLRGPRERDYTNTYNTFYPDQGIKSDTPMMSPEQLKKILITILGD